MRNSDGQQQEKVQGSQLLQLAVDPGIFHRILVFQACMNYAVIETSAWISESPRRPGSDSKNKIPAGRSIEVSPASCKNEVGKMEETLGCW